MRLVLYKKVIRLAKGLVARLTRAIHVNVRRLYKISRYVSITRRPFFHHLSSHHPFLRTLWFRTILHTSVILLILSPLYILLDAYISSTTYKLNTSEVALVGKSTVDTKYIKQTDKAITYNRAEETTDNKDLQKVLTLAASKEDATGKKPYQAELSKDPKQGITFSDSEGDRSITLKPQFTTSEARLADDRVIYPTNSLERHIYSFKTNGIKSDILLTKTPATDTKTYSWDLGLGSMLEARMLPDGGVGVYSADPNLYGNLQISDQKSQDLIDKARTNAQKNTLVFELPKPFILDANNNKTYENVVYSLTNDNKTLTLTAKNLKSLVYPLTIDPTITVTTTSDFRQKTGDTGNVDYGTDGEIRRALPDNGAVGTSTQQTNAFTNGRSGHASVQYDGYLYIVGGNNGTTFENDIQYCQLNSDGSVASCTRQTSAFTGARTDHTSVMHNGYLYIIGGYISGSAQSDIQRCKILADHSVDTCTQQTNAFTGRFEHASVVYNNYLYIIGGTTGILQNDIQYCPIKADGSIGTCTQQTNAFTTARYAHTSVVYNSYLYIVGGVDGLEVGVNDIQYCPINADGSVGTCTQQTNAFTGTRYGHTSVVYGGYLYIIGGYDAGYYDDIHYCAINPNGSVGSCVRRTGAFTTARDGHTSIVHNGYIYIIGGLSTYNDIQRVPAGPPVPPSVQQTAAFTTARYMHSTTLYGKYLYIVGGWGDSGLLNDIQYCPINTNGSVGTCTQQAAAFTTIRYGHTSVAYNGYLYIIGGYSGGQLSDIQYCPINTNGSVGTCTQQAAAFTTGRYSHASLVSQGFLYIIGGCSAATCSTYQNDIQYCPLNANGSVGTCNQQTSAFTTGRFGHAATMYNNYLYIIGGNNGSNLNDIQYCPLNANGSVGTCTQQAAAFTTARTLMQTVSDDGYMYIIGGTNGTEQSDIQYCPLNANGSVGTCTQQANALTNARYGHQSVVYEGRIYSVGGFGGTVRKDDILYTAIGSGNGGVGASTQQKNLFVARTYHSATVYDGYLYVVGGYHATSDTACSTTASYNCSDVVYCPIDTVTYAIGTCAQTKDALTNARYGHKAVASDGYLYVVGGNSGTFENDIHRCQIQTDHSVTSCIRQNNAFTNGRSEQSVAISNNMLYIVGGGYGAGLFYSDIQRCQVQSDHSVGSCIQQSNAYTTARGYSVSFIYNSYLYIVGGLATAATSLNDVQYCPINADGSVGRCVQQLGAFYVPRYDHGAFAYNGYMYIVGGYHSTSDTACHGSASNRCSDIQYCAILANGSIGNCTQHINAFAAARDGVDIASYEGYMYMAGGRQTSSNTDCDASATFYCSDVQRLQLNVVDQFARYERTIDTGSAGNNLDSITVDGSNGGGCSYTISYRSAGSDNIFSSATTITGAVSGVAQTLNLTDKRYLFVSITLDNSTCGGQSTITSIALAYNAAPDAPVLVYPANSATGIAILPELRLGSTDDSNDYLRYKIELCSTSNCSSIVRTIDQTSSQTGWMAQSVQSGTAYTGGSPLTQLALHKYQPTALSANTQYWWRAQALDPGGSNQWSDYSSISSFTTVATSADNDISIGGGNITIHGGTRITTGN